MSITSAKFLTITVLVALVTGCQYFGNRTPVDGSSVMGNGSNSSPAEENGPSGDEPRDSLSPDEVRTFLASLFHDKKAGIWQCEFPEGGGHERMQLTQAVPNADVSVLIAQLNEYFSTEAQPLVSLSAVEADTARVTVSDDQQLGERMGSAGANCYLASVTYSLTSIEPVDYVWFDIQAGSHALPGRYGRADFSDLWPLEDLYSDEQAGIPPGKGIPQPSRQSHSS